ncbi:RHOMBOID-like protein [Arachis hypogaea]|nr:RHOMBOID-like protein [Arachis hypogaea]
MAAEGGSDQFIDIVKLSPPTKFPAAFPQDLKVAPSLKRRRSGGDTLEEMGALRRNFVTEYHQTWRLFTSPFLHAGLFHLLLNLCIRIGVIYAMSAFLGALMASLFLQHTPAVASSGALYGLLGTLLSELIWNWELQIKRVSAFCLCICLQFHPCFLPYVLNFASVGGFVSGFLLGSVLLLSRKLELPKVPIKLKELSLIMVSTVKSYIKLKLKQTMDRPVLRIVSLILFSPIFGRLSCGSSSWDQHQ